MPKTTTSAAEKLRRQRNRLFRDFPKGRVPDFMLQHSRLLDEYFRNSFEASLIGPRMNITRNPYVIIAQGGYGRDDQCVHSDVDLLILFEIRVPENAEALIR